jgi:fatty-acyl-CoA synthase
MIKIFDWAGKWAEYKAEVAALAEYETGRTLSWSQLNNLACYTAGWLKNEFGIGKGDRIAILAENSLELSVLFAAAQKTGIVLVPLNFRLTSSEIDYLIGNCEPKAILAEHKFADNLTSSLHYQQTTIKISIEDITLKNDAVLASDNIYTLLKMKHLKKIILSFSSILQEPLLFQKGAFIPIKCFSGTASTPN